MTVGASVSESRVARAHKTVLLGAVSNARQPRHEGFARSGPRPRSSVHAMPFPLGPDVPVLFARSGLAPWLSVHAMPSKTNARSYVKSHESVSSGQRSMTPAI